MDKSTTLELIDFILESIRLINRRFKTICTNELDELERKILEVKVSIK